MNPRNLRYLAVALALAGVILLGQAHRKTVTVVVDGERRTLTTSAWRVRGALLGAGVDLRPANRVLPPQETWLADGEVIEVTTPAEVRLAVDEQAFAWTSAERLPLNLLAQAGVPFYPGDEVWVNGEEVDPAEPLPHAASYDLRLRRANKVVVHAGDETLEVASVAPTLAEALWEAGVTLYAADYLSMPPETPLIEALSLSLARSRPVRILLGEREIATRASALTVGGALAEAGVPLQGLDYSLPAEVEPLPADGEIRVVRVEEKVVVEQEPLPFDTQLQPLPELEIDNQRLIQPGEYGLTAKRVRVRFEDGQEVSRQVESEWVAREPVPRIQGYGTEIVVRTMDTPDGPIEYWRALTFYATSYSPARAGTPKDAPWYGHVYCGGLLDNGMVAADLDYLPCGTKLYVPGYGRAVVADTGGISGAWIDLGYTDEDYVSWHQNVTVYFLTPVPPADQIVWVIPQGALE